jgi:hypothetical protein
MPRRSKVPPAGGIAAPLLAACLLLACGHTEPLTPPPYGAEGPFDPTPPQRLTYNGGADRGAAWLADGSGLVYSTQLVDRPDRDVCLALLPPGGGSQRALWCDVPRGADWTDAIEFAAPAADGRLAFLAASGTIGSVNPTQEAIALALSLDPGSAAMVRSFPYTPEGSAPQDAAEHLRWIDATRLAYVGQQFRVRPPCPTCPPDTLRIGQAVTLLETGVPGALPVAVPGTEAATGVATDAGGDAVYYTLGGDSRVYRRILSSGVVEVVWDFGSAGVARDIHLAGRRVVAVVGGRVTFGADPQFGAVQWDSGGVIHVVDLDTGLDTSLDPGARLFRRPALSPSGTAVVAEGSPLIVTILPTTPTTYDTTVGKTVDLFLFGAP